MSHAESQTEKRLLCRHIFSEGRRCGSPALRQQDFCYHHHTTRKPVAARALRDMHSTFELPPAEDRSAIQLSISEVLRRIASCEIEPRRAGLLLYGLQIASLNLPRARPGDLPKPGELVDEIIDDPILGTLAPIAEIGSRPGEMSIGQILMEQIRVDREAAAAAAQPTPSLTISPCAELSVTSVQSQSSPSSLKACAASNTAATIQPASP